MSLGPPIRPEPAKKKEWTPVPDRPGFEVNAKGQWKYTPPPEKKPAALTDETEWVDGCWWAWLANHSGEA